MDPILDQPAAPPSMQSYDVVGIPISIIDLPGAVARIAGWSRDDVGRYVGVREVASLMAMREESDLLRIARGAAMNVPDGMPLVWIGRLRGHSVARVAGADLMEALIRHGVRGELRHFLYGGKPGVAQRLARRLEQEIPGASVVGTYCPPFRELTDEELREVLEQIHETRADVVWVGISSPRQDVWMAANAANTKTTMVGVGAAFDFLSGTVPRAPRWMRSVGLEWLHRLCSEPKRLWKRYLILAPKFVMLALCSELGRRIRGAQRE